MSKYIYFTPEEKARAQNTDLVSLLRAQGERPVRSGREFRTPNDPSITVRGNKWFDHSKREGGYAVSFVQRYYRLPYPVSYTHLDVYKRQELYLWLSDPTVITYIRNALKRVRKKESALFLASQNLEDFTQPGILSLIHI